MFLCLITLSSGMQLVILANEEQREELGLVGMEMEETLIWIKEVSDFLNHTEADVFLDLLFEHTPQRVELLKSLLPQTVIINSVIHTLEATDNNFVRMNGWNG